ncbi:MAG: exodeoxyribonuclease VII small subunit [Anaerolineae bacterium]|nr:exodeoxyribonuclease VII small subunit [Anaerolineae bacterium]
MTDLDVSQLNYEAAVKELEETITQLETGQASLEESLALFERGQRLARRCAELLNQAELRVRQVNDLEESEA